jgi:predicted Fe-S protein YdhL (DUF1289 family)
VSSNDSPGDPMTSVPSPCNSICTIDAELGLCIGCYRTLDEIASWMRLSDDRKRDVVRSLPARRAHAKR